MTMRLFKASMRPAATSGAAVAAEITNGASTIAEPVLEATPGYLTSHRGRFLSTGLPNAIDISVPANAATLSLRLRAEREGSKTELYLYDFTTGECFSYNFRFPSHGAHTLGVRKPNSGRWVAAVNAAPFPSAAGGFLLDELTTTATAIRAVSTT